MQLPISLQQAIEQEVEFYGLKQLVDAREQLTARYRGKRQTGPLMQADEERLSYLLTRMPATYAANVAVWRAIKAVIPDLKLQSLLDLGAGPGTAMWAACEELSLEKITLLEQDHSLVQFGQRFAQSSDNRAIQEAEWKIADLEKLTSLPTHDVILMSYSFGELPPPVMMALIEKCWSAAKQMVVVIEPGTPVGFERIRILRQQLIAFNGHIIAPCTHQNICPMAGTDWCHFSTRIERTSLHRRLKGGTLGYEDEKFAYLVVAKTPYPLATGRILRDPQRNSGHVIFNLCTTEGLKQDTLSKKHKEAYRLAKKLEWGDTLNIVENK